MNRTQRRKVRLKRRMTFVYAVAVVLNLGLIAILIISALQQSTWSLAWFGGWVLTAYQFAVIVLNVRATLRIHREHEDLLTKYSEDPRGRRHAT